MPSLIDSSPVMSNGVAHAHLNHTEGEDKIVPIAIVGMSLRFPDDITSADSLWSLLMEGRCASRKFPPERLNGTSFYHPDPNRGDSVS
jgi:acyl transferase domain-containing protein